MSINRDMAKAAAAAGICAEWHDRLLHTSDLQGLSEMFFNGIDFCIKRKVPSIDYLRQIGPETLEPLGIFVDGKPNLGNTRRAAFYGSCEGYAVYSGYSTGQLYCTGQTRLSVIAQGNAVVVIDAFDNSLLAVEARGNARITVFQYQGATVNAITGENAGQVKIIRKNKKTY
jgi:hypothetical protein